MSHRSRHQRQLRRARLVELPHAPSITRIGSGCRLDSEVVAGLQVVTARGVVDATVVESLDDLVTGDVPVVVDLSEAVIVDPRGLRRLDPSRWGLRAGDIGVVCRRASGRALLSRGAAARWRAFPTLDDARCAVSPQANDLAASS